MKMRDACPECGADAPDPPYECDECGLFVPELRMQRDTIMNDTQNEE